MDRSEGESGRPQVAPTSPSRREAVRCEQAERDSPEMRSRYNTQLITIKIPPMVFAVGGIFACGAVGESPCSVESDFTLQS